MRLLAGMALLLVATGGCEAHNGPPFPIITGRAMSGCTIALWTHPDVGVGTFFVVVSPNTHQRMPDQLAFRIGVAPVSGRLQERVYPTERGEENGDIRFNAAIPFDRQEMWRISLYSTSSAGSDKATATVEVTPPGLGRWDLLFFSAPFLGVAFLWFMGLKKKRLRRQARTAGP